MKEEITEPKPKAGIVKNLYYAHFAAIPTLMLIGINVGTEEFQGFISSFHERAGLFMYLGKFSFFLALIVTVGTAVGRATPPQSKLLTLLLIVDTPVAIALTSYSTGHLSTDLLYVEGVAEIMAVTLAMIPAAFVGTKGQEGDTTPIGARLASVGLVLIGASYFFLAVCLSYVEAGNIRGLWGLIGATIWGAATYFKRMRTTEMNPAMGGWVMAAICIPLFGGLFVNLIYVFFIK